MYRAKRTNPVNDLGVSRLAIDGNRNRLETMGASSPGLFTRTPSAKR